MPRSELGLVGLGFGFEVGLAGAGWAGAGLAGVSMNFMGSVEVSSTAASFPSFTEVAVVVMDSS